MQKTTLLYVVRTFVVETHVPDDREVIPVTTESSVFHIMKLY